MKKPKEGEIALIDMDGTIADYDGAIRRALFTIAGPNDPELPKEIHNCPMWLENRIDLIKKQDGFWRDLPVIEAGMVIVNALDDLGYTNIILTKGPNKTRSAWTEKTQWCDIHLNGYPLVMVDANKPQLHKAIVYGRVLFDDFPPYAKAWLDVRPRGKVIMLERNYNRHFEHPRVIKLSEEYCLRQPEQTKRDILKFLQKEVNA